jgi:hypothetical protein
VIGGRYVAFSLAWLDFAYFVWLGFGSLYHCITVNFGFECYRFFFFKTNNTCAMKATFSSILIVGDTYYSSSEARGEVAVRVISVGDSVLC